jgi:hypothetical protein
MYSTSWPSRMVIVGPGEVLLRCSRAGLAADGEVLLRGTRSTNIGFARSLNHDVSDRACAGLVTMAACGATP